MDNLSFFTWRTWWEYVFCSQTFHFHDTILSGNFPMQNNSFLSQSTCTIMKLYFLIFLTWDKRIILATNVTDTPLFNHWPSQFLFYFQHLCSLCQYFIDANPHDCFHTNLRNSFFLVSLKEIQSISEHIYRKLIEALPNFPLRR